MTKETTRQTKTNHNQTNHDQTKTNHQNQPPALPPRGLGRCPISKTVPLPYAVSRPIDLRRDAILWRPERPQWSMQMAAPGALKSAGVGLAGELRPLVGVKNPRPPLKLKGRGDVKGRTTPPLQLSTSSSLPWCVGNGTTPRSEEHTSELQSPCNLVCRLLLEKKN